VRRVEDHGRVARGAHARDRAHVDHEVAVAEERAALGDRDGVAGRQRRALAPAARPPHLVDRAAHPLGVHPLPFLDVHRAPRRAGRLEEVGLAAQERRDLQHVGDLGDRCALLGEVHVREDAQPGLLFHAGERREPALEPRTTRRAGVRTIGLVEAGLEHHAAGDSVAETRDVFGDAEVERVVLELARAGDEEQRAARGTRRARAPVSCAAPARPAAAAAGLT
jgi:hypothetical protein